MREETRPDRKETGPQHDTRTMLLRLSCSCVAGIQQEQCAPVDPDVRPMSVLALACTRLLSVLPLVHLNARFTFGFAFADRI